MWISFLLVILGLVLLKQGASWFVDGSAGLAKKLNVSELAIGLTVVAFGTSAPELGVNVFAVTQGIGEELTDGRQWFWSARILFT